MNKILSKMINCSFIGEKELCKYVIGVVCGVNSCVDANDKDRQVFKNIFKGPAFNHLSVTAGIKSIIKDEY